MNSDIDRGSSAPDLQTALVHWLKEHHMKISFAESLTGGLVSKKITEVSGASEVFECGICSYSNRIKNQLLHVSAETLAVYTEYSRQTAMEMADGIRRISGSDIAVSTTGLAGPGGGTEEQPVGLVYIGISSGHSLYAEELHLSGNREEIRSQAAEYALLYAFKELNGTKF